MLDTVGVQALIIWVLGSPVGLIQSKMNRDQDDGSMQVKPGAQKSASTGLLT